MVKWKSLIDLKGCEFECHSQKYTPTDCFFGYFAHWVYLNSSNQIRELDPDFIFFYINRKLRLLFIYTAPGK